VANVMNVKIKRLIGGCKDVGISFAVKNSTNQKIPKSQNQKVLL
jgi:hypothetical protein